MYVTTIYKLILHDRQTHTLTHTHTHTCTHRCAHTHTQTDRQTDTDSHTHTLVFVTIKPQKRPSTHAPCADLLYSHEMFRMLVCALDWHSCSDELLSCVFSCSNICDLGLGDMAENCITISVFHIGRYR